MATEKYARPGLYRDDDDHARLLDENRDAFRRDRAERLRREIREKQRKLDQLREEDAR